MSEQDSEELVEDAQIDGVRGPSRFGGFVRGVLVGGLLCGGAALVFSLASPLPDHLPGVGSVEIVGSGARERASEEAATPRAAEETPDQTTEAPAQESTVAPVGQEPEPESTSEAATPGADSEGTQQPGTQTEAGVQVATAPAAGTDEAASTGADPSAQGQATEEAAGQSSTPASDEVPTNAEASESAEEATTATGDSDETATQEAGTGDAAATEGAPTAEAGQADQAETPEAPRVPKLDGPALTVNARSFEAPEGAPLLAVVLEDAGNGAVPNEALTLMTMPLTLAIRPDGEAARTLADAARGSGHEVLAQLPVDPEADGTEVAEGALASSLTPEALQELTNRYLAELDSAIGVTTPATGRVQNTPRALEAVLEPVTAHGFAYLDLKPGIGSTARRIAQDTDLAYVESNRFVAAGATEDQVYQMLEGAAFQARRQGSAIVSISASAAALKALVRWGLERGGQEVWFAPLSAVIARQKKGS